MPPAPAHRSALFGTALPLLFLGGLVPRYPAFVLTWLILRAAGCRRFVCGQCLLCSTLESRRLNGCKIQWIASSREHNSCLPNSPRFPVGAREANCHAR